MNEVYADQDDWEDEDESYDPLEDDLAALEDRLDEQESLAAVNSVIREMERAHGSSFTQEEVNQIGQLLDQGHEPAAIYEVVEPAHPDDQAFNNHFERSLARVEHEHGRELQQSEVDNLYRQAEQLDDPTHIEPDVVRDLTTKQGRIGHINERLAEPTETPETVAPLAEDAGPKERIAFLDARHGGAEVEDTSYEGEEE